MIQHYRPVFLGLRGRLVLHELLASSGVRMELAEFRSGTGCQWLHLFLLEEPPTRLVHKSYQHL